jgi:hypothetical protein
MRKKLLMLGLLVTSGALYAETPASQVPAANQAFQEFDNQFYLGYGASYGSLRNAYGQTTNYGTTNLALGVERLFDMGLWLRFDAQLMTGYSNFNSTNPNAGTGPLGQNPSVANLNLKAGYGFIPAATSGHLMLTPYVLLGRNTNLTTNSLQNAENVGSNGLNNLSTNVTQNYFLTGGIGGRIEYRLDKIALFYFDQNAVYNYDNSAVRSGLTSASNYQATSTLGAKVNIWRELQLGASGFYTYNQLSGSMATAQQYQLYPQNQVGIMATVGLTY